MHDSVGGVETTSMARGYEAADAMLKAAPVRLLLSRTVCPGKYLVLVSGGVAEVAASVEAGAARAAEALADRFAVANLHPEVLPAIEGLSGVGEIEALGVIETFSAASLIEAADACVKAAPVRLVELRLAMAMGGKGLVSFTGSVAAVEAAAAAGAASAGAKGLLTQKAVIPQPRRELLRDLL